MARQSAIGNIHGLCCKWVILRRWRDSSSASFGIGGVNSGQHGRLFGSSICHCETNIVAGLNSLDPMPIKPGRD